MPEQPDPETQKINREQQMVADFVKSDGWQHVKAELMKKLTTIDSISAMPDMPPEQLLLELKSRAGAVSLLREWINEIEGTAQQAANNTAAAQPPSEEEIISHFGAA